MTPNIVNTCSLSAPLPFPPRNRRRSQHEASLYDTFTDIDVKKRGYIDLRSFMEALRKHPEIQQYLHLNSVEEGAETWKRIDADQGQHVDVEEFSE